MAMMVAGQDTGNNTESQELGIKSDEKVHDHEITSDEPEEDKGLPPTPEQLRLQRYAKMMNRAGFTPEKHVEHLARVQKKEGADAVKLGAVSGQQYKDIFKSRAFDKYFFQIPPKKSSLEMLSKVAQKILSKDPTADEEHRKLEEEAKLGGEKYAGKSKQKNLKENANRHPIGFKEDLFGPPGLAPPQKNILKSEGKEKYFSYDGGWADGRMHGYGTYRFADGMTYEGVMRDNWPSGHGTAHYSNGGVFVGGWKDGKYEGHGKLTCPEAGIVYEGGWHEGQRSGRGTLTFKSGSKYKGDFLLGVYHGRGRFKSENLNVSYDGWWSSGFICGHGTLTMPDGTTTVRAWPRQSRFGGGLSLRGAVEIVQIEREKAKRDKADEKQALYGVTELVELQFRVQNIRRAVTERRSVEKAEDRAEAAARRKAAKMAMMEAKLKALLDAQKDEEPDDIEKEFMV